MLRSAIITSFLLATCTAHPQAAPAPSPTPTIPWPTKFSALRSYILSQPDTSALPGFSTGPTLSQTFADGTCYQVRFYNWDCTHPIIYKARGVVAWLDSIGPSIDVTSPSWNPARSYVSGYYVDPDDRWNFYGASKLAFGSCGNRGLQSACGMTFCVDAEGRNAGGGKVVVPEGSTPYLDPNDREDLCAWLRNGTVGQGE